MSQANINKNPSFSIETDFFLQGDRIISGVDEAGRGSLAGPLSVGMVIFPEKYYSDIPDELLYINDSKKLTKIQRNSFFEIIKKHSVYWDVILISPEKIDSININQATKYAIEQLISRSRIKTDVVLIDGNFNFDLNFKYKSIKKGDSISMSIAAASICAKVVRDNYMNDISKKYPEYGFDKNSGYGTKLHREAISKYGGTSIHRKTYEPYKSILLNEDSSKY